MKIKNVKEKLIHIGTASVMPGDSINISKETAELPSVKCLLRMGYLKEVKEGAPKAKKSANKEDNNDASAEAENK